MAKVFARRWRGFTAKEVSERMAMLAHKRFKTEDEKKAFSRAGVEARGHWEVVDGKRIFIRKI